MSVSCHTQPPGHVAFGRADIDRADEHYIADGKGDLRAESFRAMFNQSSPTTSAWGYESRLTRSLSSGRASRGPVGLAGTTDCLAHKSRRIRRRALRMHGDRIDHLRPHRDR